MNNTRNWQSIMLPAEYAQPVGAYSPAVVAGDLIFVSGQVPADPHTGKIINGDLRAQVLRTFENLQLVLKTANASLTDVVSITTYLADIAQWDIFNQTFREIFSPPYPSRTAIGAQLGGFLIEVNAIAYRGKKA